MSQAAGDALQQALEVEGGDLVEGRRREHHCRGAAVVGGASEGNQLRLLGREAADDDRHAPGDHAHGRLDDPQTLLRGEAQGLAGTAEDAEAIDAAAELVLELTGQGLFVQRTALGEGREHGGDDAVQLLHSVLTIDYSLL